MQTVLGTALDVAWITAAAYVAWEASDEIELNTAPCNRAWLRGAAAAALGLLALALGGCTGGEGRPARPPAPVDPWLAQQAATEATTAADYAAGLARGQADRPSCPYAFRWGDSYAWREGYLAGCPNSAAVAGPWHDTPNIELGDSVPSSGGTVDYPSTSYGSSDSFLSALRTVQQEQRDYIATLRTQAILQSNINRVVNGRRW